MPTCDGRMDGQNYISVGLSRLHIYPDESVSPHPPFMVARQTVAEHQTPISEPFLHYSVNVYCRGPCSTTTCGNWSVSVLDASDKSSTSIVNDFVQNSTLEATTGLPSTCDMISRRRSSLFGYVVRLDDRTPSCSSSSTETGSGGPRSCLYPSNTWRRRPGPRLNSLRQSPAVINFCRMSSLYMHLSE